MADWVAISSLATAGGTLALAGATLAAVKSANHPSAPESAEAGQRIEDREPVTVDLLYGDHEGGQRVVTRFLLTHAPTRPSPSPRFRCRSLWQMSVDEARVEQTPQGAVVASPGWFVLNMADVAWTRDPRGGEWANPAPEAGEFEHYGIGIHVLHPGQPNGLYHSESVQEDFLVLSGECLLVIEEEERLLKAWDFVHCAPGTKHIFVGAGNGPCAILMVGAQGEGKRLHYPPSEVAAKHGAASSEETDDPREAYRDWPRDFIQVRATWPL